MADGQRVDWWQILMGIGIMALGTVAKDSNVTNAPNPVPGREVK